jgi:hypothetical protein
VKWSREKEQYLVRPETVELVFGLLDEKNEPFPETAPPDESSCGEAVAVDLMNSHAVSRPGVAWLVELLSRLRARGFQPFIVCDPSWERLLERTILKKIVPIGHTLNPESKNFGKAVGNLEKDFLWEPDEEDPAS